MTRRKGAQVLYAIVRFRCRRGHPLEGKAWRTDLAGSTPPVEPEYVITGELEMVTAPDGSHKLRMRCPLCEAEGRRPDVQVAWERRVVPTLDETHRNGARGVAWIDL